MFKNLFGKKRLSAKQVGYLIARSIIDADLAKFVDANAMELLTDIGHSPDKLIHELRLLGAWSCAQATTQLLSVSPFLEELQVGVLDGLREGVHQKKVRPLFMEDIDARAPFYAHAAVMLSIQDEGVIGNPITDEFADNLVSRDAVEKGTATLAQLGKAHVLAATLSPIVIDVFRRSTIFILLENEYIKQR